MRESAHKSLLLSYNLLYFCLTGTTATNVLRIRPLKSTTHSIYKCSARAPIP
jgi:hypothetical protein